MITPLELSLLVIITLCSYFRAIFWVGTYLKVELRDAYSENAPLPGHYPTHNELDGNLQKQNHASRWHRQGRGVEGIKARFTLRPDKNQPTLKWTV